MNYPIDRPIKLEISEAKTFTFGQGRVNVLFESEPVACGLFTLEPNGVGSVDVHDRAVELLWVLKGAMEYTAGGETFLVEAGSGMAIPPKLAHTVRNAGEGEAQVLWMFVPNDH
jgi:mannose-6-phosphate isomerase-like protein (cupin superfamily)